MQWHRTAPVGDGLVGYRMYGSVVFLERRRFRQRKNPDVINHGFGRIVGVVDGAARPFRFFERIVQNQVVVEMGYRTVARVPTGCGGRVIDSHNLPVP